MRCAARLGAEKELYTLVVRAGLAALTMSSLVAFCACSSSSNAPQAGIYLSCANVDASTTCADPAPTFDGSVMPILAKSCLPACHDDSPDANWPLTDYDDVKAWANFVTSDILRCTMPPIESAAKYPITREDRETILQWIVCGAAP
jgi:hypothetical protein